METIVTMFLTAMVTTALCFTCIRIGFRMGRMTQDKPVETPKTFDPGGEPVLDEDDAYEEALARPGAKSTVEG